MNRSQSSYFSSRKKAALVAATLVSQVVTAQTSLIPSISKNAEAIESKVIEWRRDFHQHPELGNQEVRTADIVAQHLRKLGLEVQEKVAVTGVVGILKGGKPGPVVALRADMDALPVTERVDVPFKSTVRTTFNDQETGVMHACGHDAHVAILMGVAEVLAAQKNQIAGTVKFIFQPSEEGVVGLDSFGAKQMVEEGVLENPKVDAIFGLHINSVMDAGTIRYRPGATMAASDRFHIKVKGQQSHGARPWTSVDPIVTSAQIITSLQTIVSRNVDISTTPAVVTVGAIHGGIRNNIIPESVEMIGTIRTYNNDHQSLIHRRVEEIATHIAESAGAKSEVKIVKNYPVTFNDHELTDKMVPTLERIAGADKVSITPLQTGAEDFSRYQKVVPGLFYFLGARKSGVAYEDAPPHHTPDFFIEENSLLLGVKSLAALALDYLDIHKIRPAGKKK
jgi:amidohydrolase